MCKGYDCMQFSGNGKGKNPRNERTLGIIKKRHRLPISVYIINDRILRLGSRPSFVDALLAAFAFVVLALAFPFYPVLLLIPLVIVIFFAGIKHPFFGLLVFMLLAFPIFVYQMPPIALIFLFILSFSLIYGYMHYRMIIFAYIMLALGFTPLGYIFEVPFMILAPLMIGFKRAALVYLVVILGIAAFSGTIGLQNYGYVVYSASLAHVPIANNSIVHYIEPNRPILGIGTFSTGISNAYSRFINGTVLNSIPEVLGMLFQSMIEQPLYLIQVIIAIITGFLIEFFAVNNRSRYRGTMAGMFGIAFPLSYIALSYISKVGFTNYMLPLMSFAIAIAGISLLELYNFKVVKALDVRKQDIRMKFGEAFEDLESGNTNETFDDIGNYENVKKELRDSVISPIERRGVSRAYNLKMIKGMLLFGPPGTGKTMMMRALANEIHAGFFYVKASALMSAYSGESEKLVTNIFMVAKKHTPCVLFMDEIDYIAYNREAQTDDVHKHALTQLLSEMDGFEKLDDVVIVGATNVPNVLDQAILRPGRFDKIMYMQLPDANARKIIFSIYLKTLPLAGDIDLDEISKHTERYSGADIRAVCDSVAQMVAQEAAAQHKILEISQKDILKIVDKTKPSTSLSQLDQYNMFKVEYERLRKGTSDGQSDNTEKLDFSKVIGLDDAKKAIVEAIQIPLMHPDLLQKYDIKTINGLLLFGPPGTGKTMLMNAVTQELNGVTMLQLDGSSVQEYGANKANNTIKELFYTALENKPSIIFIDEIDGIIRKREGASEASVQITTELLAQMDGIKKTSGVVIVAATNRPEMLDPAILRPGRFDKIIFVKPPNASQRAALFKEYLSSVPGVDDLDYNALGKVTSGYTGADISNICREAKMQAIEENMKTGKEANINTDMLNKLITRIKPSAPDAIMGGYLAFMTKYGQR